MPFRRETLLGFQCILLFLVSTCVENIESADKKPPLRCEETKDDFVCTFAIAKKEKEDVQLEFCNGGYCVKLAVSKEEVVQQVPVKLDFALTKEQVAAKKDEVITVGSREYKPPYDQYGKRVGKVLQEYAKQKPSTLKGMMEYANWFADLAKAYREDAKTLDNVVDWARMDIPACLHASEHAIALYKQAVDKHPTDARLSLAAVQSYLAEANQYHTSNPQPKEALKHYLDSQENYKIALDSNVLAKVDRDEWELYWADVLVHAALLLIEDASAAQSEQHVEDVLDISHMLDSVKKAERFLEDAIHVFRKAVLTFEGGDQVFYQLQLATCLKNLGTAIMLTSTIGRANVILEESYTIFNEVFPKLQKKSPDSQDTALAMAELLITLSDGYLQVGNYDDSKARYQEAMKWYLGYNLVLPQEAVLMTESNELLQETEIMLEEYGADVYGGRGIQIPDDYRESNQPLYEPDDLYEADLHATIGAIQLSNGQVELAMTSLVKAIDLYEAHMGEERAIADVKLNMGMALFRLREFDESARLHAEALELFRETVGEGKNPLASIVGATAATDASYSSVDSENEDSVVRTHLVNFDDFRQSLPNVTSNDEL
jgi:tetratricopeptide (TPR) repeat protein